MIYYVKINVIFFLKKNRSISSLSYCHSVRPPIYHKLIVIVLQSFIESMLRMYNKCTQLQDTKCVINTLKTEKK